MSIKSEDLLTGVYKTLYHVEMSDKQITTVALNTKYLDNILISFIFFYKGQIRKTNPTFISNRNLQINIVYL